MIMNQRGNDEFQTPQELFNQLNRIFSFELDTACTVKNCKCKLGLHIDGGSDGLKDDWGGYRVFCNPPFSKKADFIKKAHDEVMGGQCPICVMILPLNCMDGKAFQEFVYCKFHYDVMRGRVAFIDPKTMKPMKGNNSGTIIVYFKKDITR